MSALYPHIVAMRARSKALRFEAENSSDRGSTVEILCLMADAEEAAANELEEQMAAEIGAGKA